MDPHQDHRCDGCRALRSRCPCQRHREASRCRALSRSRTAQCVGRKAAVRKRRRDFFEISTKVFKVLWSEIFGYHNYLFEVKWDCTYNQHIHNTTGALGKRLFRFHYCHHVCAGLYSVDRRTIWRILRYSGSTKVVQWFFEQATPVKVH